MNAVIAKEPEGRLRQSVFAKNVATNFILNDRLLRTGSNNRYKCPARTGKDTHYETVRFVRNDKNTCL